MNRTKLSLGTNVPWFTCSCSNNNNKFYFETVAGRYIVLCFYGSTFIEKNAQVINYCTNELRHFFNDQKVAFFGVSVDPKDRELNRVKTILPGIRYFWDFDYQVSLLYGAIESLPSPSTEPIHFNSFTLVIDPSLRIIAHIPIREAEKHNEHLSQILANLPELDNYAGVFLHAPVLIIPRVFEPSFCKQLIELYQKNGGKESGFMREQEGKTIGVMDDKVKRRKDYNMHLDPANNQICHSIQKKIFHRLIPSIEKAFQFKITRMERYIISCYEAENRGFFHPHRDNTTKGTAHRRFACTINLNAEDYEGGDLRFPEFGTKTYRAPTGGAVVFSCSLLHEATPVTKGVRYAFLPFLYDEEGARIRKANQKFLTDELVNLNQ